MPDEPCNHGAYRIPNAWGTIEQSLQPYKVPKDSRAIQLLEENHHSLEDVISELRRRPCGGGSGVAASTRWIYGTEGPTHWLEVDGFPTYFDLWDGNSFVSHKTSAGVDPIEPLSWSQGGVIVPVDGVYEVSGSVMVDFGPGDVLAWAIPGHGQIEMSMRGEATGTNVAGPDYSGLTGLTEWTDRTSWIVLPDDMRPSYGQMAVSFHDTLWLGAGATVHPWSQISLNMPGLYWDGGTTQRRAYASCSLVMPWDRERAGIGSS